MTCHQKLIDDETHISMTMCATCHKKSSNDLSIFSTMNDGCGDRCFDCHDKWPKDGYHADLDKCIECHTKQ
ncbi:hypothetical protein FHQ18_03300 [Deferribacter autotrophicus]|uniref:Doubled CXXCH motif domain-containing protein n=2 Tax=Deferribacter autotrophicus TaxID=500465 RepID=A0A5A8F8R2_9BACT|nr:hypothetical protein FHQ18_03300 [Deferribacter autotrophicus]